MIYDTNIKQSYEMNEVCQYIVSNELKKKRRKNTINNIQKLHQENPLITIDKFENILKK